VSKYLYKIKIKNLKFKKIILAKRIKIIPRGYLRIP